MRRITTLLTVLALSTGGAMAQPPEEMPTNLPPNLSQAALDIVSGPVYIQTAVAYGILKELGSEDTPSTSSTSSLEPRENRTSTKAAQSLFTHRANNDFQEDTEPSIIAALDGNATSICYIKRTDAGNFRNFSAFTTDFSAFTRNVLPIPGRFTDSADPLQSANVFDTGIAPRRIYLTGILFNGGEDQPPNAIGVWRSDDGGATWSMPTIVDESNSSDFFLDKPDVDVHWYSGRRGHAYVAYVRIDNSNSNNTQVKVARSTDGGLSFSTPVTVAQGRYQGVQMLSSPFGNRIYVIWVDFANDRLLMSWSDDGGSSWTSPEFIASGELLDGADPVNGLRRAVTLPMARYNHIDNSIGVVWHEYDGSSIEIYFARKDGSGWSTKKRINFPTTNDQFMPALDFDPVGNYIVVFYDRSADPNNLLYQESWVQIDPDGNVLDRGVEARNYQTDPTDYTFNFIGDYQDIWWWDYTDTWGDRFNAIWSGWPFDRSNPYVSGIK